MRVRVRVVPGQPVTPDHPGPYGLHHLSDQGMEPEFAPMALPAGEIGRLVNVVNYRLTDLPVAEVLRDRWQDRGHDTPIVTWDERHGLWSKLGSTRPVATGVIWATEPDDRHRRLAHLLLKRMALVWPISAGQMSELREAFAVPASRLRYVRFGIDHHRFPLQDPVASARIASAGNDRHRDHDTLLEAVALLQRRLPDARLDLLCRQDVRVPATLGRRWGASEGMTAADLYRQAAVVAIATSPNLHVSGLTVSLEAMASGRAVVATGTPGWDDYVEHGVTGLLSPPGDREALATNLHRLLADPEEAAAMGAAGRRRLEELELTEEGLARRLAEALHQL